MSLRNVRDGLRSLVLLWAELGNAGRAALGED
jgi:hypothetical protein